MATWIDDLMDGKPLNDLPQHLIAQRVPGWNCRRGCANHRPHAAPENCATSQWDAAHAEVPL